MRGHRQSTDRARLIGADGERSSSPGQLLRGLSILIVEDDVASARLWSALLTNEGGDVRVVRSGEEALALLCVFRARVIVLDLMLPGMSGLLLAQQLKARPSTSDIPVVAVSTVDSPDVERISRDAGCMGYVPKPIDASTFASTIAEHVRNAMRTAGVFPRD